MISRSYCGTLFLDKDDWPLYYRDDVESLYCDVASDSELWLSPDTRYSIRQVEQCPDSERLHIQCYLELRRPVRPAGLISQLPVLRGAHLEPRRGTRDQVGAVGAC